MFAKIMTWICVAVLFPTVIWRPSGVYQILLQFVVCAGAIAITIQAVRERNYALIGAFVVVAALFNPVLPVPLSPGLSLWLAIFSVAMFLVSLAAFKTEPRLSIPSITDRTPGSESL